MSPAGSRAGAAPVTRTVSSAFSASDLKVGRARVCTIHHHIYPSPSPPSPPLPPATPFPFPFLIAPVPPPLVLILTRSIFIGPTPTHLPYDPTIISVFMRLGVSFSSTVSWDGKARPVDLVSLAVQPPRINDYYCALDLSSAMRGLLASSQSSMLSRPV
ncbi:hypothetical protein L226DRAFT_354894 [Lentinus tigrinus ALCF2SS1-7]|uniref:uncharacterized protein n=1 Tax=Lentinus tigrinus ALCF2SS1-7 TaxID=1328758 RepID=UPI0011663ADB|nr:hypothetical protein L226DRAFT_354894 [Lentinus tigrinus ALCF2SS1-7]